MSSEDKKPRSHLPIPAPERTGLITYDARDPDTKFPPIEQLRPPKGEIRSQFHHVIDLAPTILEAAGLPEPVPVHGVQQRPIAAVSMLYSFDDAKPADRHEPHSVE